MKKITIRDVENGVQGAISVMEFAQIVACSPKMLLDLISKDPQCPKTIENNYLPLVDMLRYMSRRPASRGGGAAIQSRAQYALREFTRKTKEPLPPDDLIPQNVVSYRYGNLDEAKRNMALTKQRAAAPTPTPSPAPAPDAAEPAAPPVPPRPKGEKGIGHALERLRDAEHILGERALSEVAAEDPAATATVKLWNTVQEQLRRLESEHLELLVEQGRYIPADAAKRVVSNVVSSVKSRLLLLPSQVCNELADRDAHDIRDILQMTVEGILDALAKTVAANESKEP